MRWSSTKYKYCICVRLYSKIFKLHSNISKLTVLIPLVTVLRPASQLTAQTHWESPHTQATMNIKKVLDSILQTNCQGSGST